MIEGYEVVWVFHGEGARFASALFHTKADGVRWAALHGVSGVLTEYPVGDGCYDISVELGRFTPSRDHHGTPQHVANFSSGWEHVHIVDGVVA